MRPARRLIAALALCAAAVPAARADVFVLTNGDRVTGKRLRTTKRTFFVQTEFGQLNIPRARVERIVKDDGTEDVINSAAETPATFAPTTPAAPTKGMPLARLVLIVVGKSFWLAWDPKNNPNIDPSLRMEVRLDGEVVASYVDLKQDPKDLPGTTVNTFSFLEGEFEMEAGAGVRLAPPEVRPGRASLKLDVPHASDRVTSRKLKVTYQFNTGSADEPEWKDLISAEAPFDLTRKSPNFVLLRQDPGKMEFSGFNKKRMRNIETFRLELTPGS
jgi:hypothetical protein